MALHRFHRQVQGQVQGQETEQQQAPAALSNKGFQQPVHGGVKDPTQGHAEAPAH
ncbi:MAG: hypothetical protein ACK5O3_15360 [Burkholderiales bacterium]